MKQFIVLAVAATLFGLVLATSHDSSYRGSYRTNGGYRQNQGYGYGYKKCPKLEDPENGRVKFYHLRPGSKAVHTCDEGYELVGVDVRTCQKDGTWSYAPPTCEPVDCGEPDAIENGSVNTSEGTTFGNVAVYSCDVGYKIDEKIQGAVEVVCLATKAWSDTSPICKPVKCGIPQHPDVNGALVYGETTYLNEATYTCNVGYELPGNVEQIVVICEADADWSQAAPDCTPVNCGMPPAANDNGGVDVSGTTLRKTAVYSADDGYVLDFSAGGSQQIYCQENGLWSGIPPLNARIDCGYIDVPQNGEIEYVEDTKLDSTAEFSCSRKYKLVGVSERTCQTNGDWSDESPVCERIRCPKLEAPKGGKVIVSGYYVDDYAIYRCGYGYNLSGYTERRVCQVDGTWSGTEPKCTYDDKYYDDSYGYDAGYGHSQYGRGGYDNKKDYQ